MTKRGGLIFLFLALAPLKARAGLFSVTLRQNAQTAFRQYSSAKDLMNAYEEGRLDTVLPGYDRTQTASGVVNFRGVRMELDYDREGRLSFKVPSLNIDQVFGTSGRTQEISFKEFKAYLKNNRSDLLSRILKESVSSTPYDSMAGNPFSLMSQMTDVSFSAAGAFGDGKGFSVSFPAGGVHRIKGPDGEHRTAKTFALPPRYVFELGNGAALGIDLPLSYINLDGSETYAVQFGASLQVPLIKDRWFLTAGLRAGTTLSEDALSGGLLYMGTLTSRSEFNIGQTVLTVTNMIGFVKDRKLEIEGYNVDYKLKNNVFKNGVRLERSLSGGHAVSVFFYDTRYAGSDLYIDAYEEAGVSWSKTFGKNAPVKKASLDDLSGAFGSNYRACKAGLKLLF